MERPDRGPSLSSARRPSLLQSFAAISLVVILLIGLALTAILRDSIRSRAIADASRTGEVAARVGVLPLLEVDDLQRSFMPIPADRVDEIDEALRPVLSPNGVKRIKVWNRQHWLVYSDNPNLVGRWFAGADVLERSFAGEVTTEITDLTAPEEREEREFGELLAVYVPLRSDGAGSFTADGTGEVIGAFEIYLAYAPIAADIERDTQRVVIALAVGLLALYLSLFQLVRRAARTIRRQGAENLRRAQRDDLTGLANRDWFQQSVADVLAVAPHPVDVGPITETATLLLFDIDGFQTINDTLGHDRGDEVIRVLAARLASSVRADDVVARLGGDEFGVLVDGLEPGETGRTVADRLLHALAEPVEIDGIQLDVHCSAGISRYPIDGLTADELLRQADIAMYAAKRSNSVVAVYHADLDHFSADTLQLVSDVRRGIVDGEFWLAYQPQVAIDNGEIVGYEALVRWTHPERGFVSPGEFIPAIESLPVCRALTDHVLGAAVSQLGVWSAAGHDTNVAVNLSARDASDPALPGVIAGLLRQHGVAASQLHLELTEGSALSDPDRTRQVLGELREIGCEIAIDDFGTGYASLSFITALPITALKIDQSFVRDIHAERQAEAIVRHSIDLGHALGLTIVAEGIEDDSTLQQLALMGCDIAQGYFLGRPAPVGDLVIGPTHDVVNEAVRTPSFEREALS